MMVVLDYVMVGSVVFFFGFYLADIVVEGRIGALAGHIEAVGLVGHIELAVGDCKEQHTGEGHLYQFVADEKRTRSYPPG